MAFISVQAMATSQKKLPSGTQRYKSSSRKLSSTATRRKWRTVKVKYQRTPLEKAIVKEHRQARVKDLNEALDEARQVIKDEARKLKERFGGHSEQYFFEQLLQMSRFSKSQRKVSKWNAYYRSQVKLANEGRILLF